MKKIRWNSSANKLKNIIYRDLMGTLTLELNTDSGVTSSFGECAEYFACCNVFNDNRLEVMPDDVVKSWLLTLNLFLMDLRPYIKDFNSASDMITDTGSEFKPINISECQSNNKSSSIIRKVLGGVLSIIIVFLLLIVMSTILILIFGDALDNFIGLLRPVGIIGLALAAALGKEIYNKLV
ncbi:hypothetical protein [uncultured Methanobrevibacter sp.]|uniref:hypothetical protein n=1 Tax=uncultured Methanobrevibacter sp. TaxID=253161 RepID=UPI0025D36D8C|nr:hypothetical protein [uncultured Methanobrevibacter sp.]